MITQNVIIQRLEQPYTAHLMEICSTGEVAERAQMQSIFSKANMIVDAQFYYSNPLIYILLSGEVSTHYANLYANYYLLPPKIYDSLTFDTNHIAVNAKFLDDIGSIADLLSGHNNRKELELNEGKADNSLFGLYQSFGLYIIGVYDDVA